MCGIAGFFQNISKSEVNPQTIVSNMSKSMEVRGPDADGLWAGKDITLGHRRLSILDLNTRADQPMLSNCGRYAIVFNGEIYNFRDLRRDLEKNGITFQTQSDTEVLLALYVAKGEAMLTKLRGMFAFAIWDKQLRELFLARDPYGIKPLYYATTKNGFIFASQVKALLSSGIVSKRKELAGVAGFYLWGSVPEPWTLYQGVYAVPAGHWMKIRDSVPDNPVCWHDIREHWCGKSEKISNDDLQKKVHCAVKDSVKNHLVSDVPISIFLSGGIDSGILAGLVSELGVSVEGVTLGFKEFVGSQRDETTSASAIASYYGIPHHIKWVSRSEFEQDMPYILEAMDQPTIDGVNTWFASKAANERGYKVSMSGVGGDELFCGYSSFKRIPNLVSWAKIIKPIINSGIRTSSFFDWVAKYRSQPKIAAIPKFIDSLEKMYFLERCLFLPEELPDLMGLDNAKEGLERLGGDPPGVKLTNAIDGTSSVGILESKHYLRNQLLRDTDWASMSHSLELRTPLVDIALLSELGPYVPNFSGGVGKILLSKAARRPLPDYIINQPKSGFGLPLDQWLIENNTDRMQFGSPDLKSSEIPWAKQWAIMIMREF